MRAHRGRARVRRSDGRSDDGTFKNLYNNDLTTEGTARVILPVLLFARLTLSFSLSFPRVPFPSLCPSHLLLSSSSTSLARSSSPSRERRRSLSLAFAVVLPACVYGCSSSFKLCSEVPSSSSSSSFSRSFFSSSRVLLPPLPLRCRLHLLFLCAGTPLLFARASWRTSSDYRK